MLAIRLAPVIMVAGALACGGDNPVGPNSMTFPDWPAPILTGFCVRGNVVVGETRSGTISDADCDATPLHDHYFEVWRFRVASSRDVTFDANSIFDNFLSVLRVTSVSATSLNIDVVDDNNDRSPTDRNALVTVRLEPNVDYAVAVAGFDYGDTGPYTLAVR